MERNHKKKEIVGHSDKCFGEDSQYPGAKAGESQHYIDWFKMAEQSMILSRLLTDQRGRLNETNL